MNNEKVATGLRVFGLVFFVVCVGLVMWSLFRPTPVGPTSRSLHKLYQDSGVQVDSGR